MARNQPSLPAKRAYVVQVHADVRVEQHDFKGRVEHLCREKSRPLSHVVNQSEPL